MSSYQRVIQAFQKAGYYDESLVSQNQLIKVLDIFAKQNGQFAQYDRSVAAQLWDETPKEANGKVYLRNYVQTLLKGESIVRNQISSLQHQIENLSNQRQKNQKLQDLQSYTQDLYFLTIPFGLAAPRDSKLLAHSKNQSNKSVSNSTVIFAKDHTGKGRGKSTDLKFVFLISLLCLSIEILMMFHRHHFHNLLIYLLIFSIFFLNYFDAQYIKFVLVTILVSIVLDIAWMAVNAKEYWNPDPETQHSTLHNGFLKFIVMFTVFMMFPKIIIGAILVKYRSNPTSLRKQCNIFGANFPLDGTPDSPVAKIIGGQNNYSAAQAYQPY